ncbi:hypothetical protein LTR94_025859, partial [Friedmanniomyces endolithicus]
MAQASAISDGPATEAACGPLGFALAPPTPVVQPSPVGTARPIRAAPNVSPPPPVAITPTKKEDRVEYVGPPVIVPGPPPPPAPPFPPPPPPPSPPPPAPPAPPSPSRPALVSEVSTTGARAPLLQVRPQADRETYPDASANRVKRTAQEPVSTLSVDVDTAAYANVRRFIQQGSRPPVDAVRVEELINYFDYGYERPSSQDEPFAVTTTVTASPWAEGRQIVHIGLQGYELPEASRRPLNLTFLVDVSGSMGGPDRLELAQKTMNLAIDRLRPQDTLALTYYAHGAGTLLQPTSGSEKLKLRCAVASLRASGGTAGAAGLTNAYDQAQAGFAPGKVNRILMFTDGDFNVGVTDNKRLEDYVAEKRSSGVYLSVYGFGRGNYQDSRMQAIAQAGNGIAAYVDSLAEARRLFGPAFDKGAFPIADDVKLQVEFNPARVAEWRLVGYETRLLNEADFSNDRIDAGEVGSGASVTALYEITPVGGPLQSPPRRYDAAPERPASGADDEIGFIKLRYKLPGSSRSALIE